MTVSSASFRELATEHGFEVWGSGPVARPGAGSRGQGVRRSVKGAELGCAVGGQANRPGGQGLSRLYGTHALAQERVRPYASQMAAPLEEKLCRRLRGPTGLSGGGYPEDPYRAFPPSPDPENAP